MIAPEEIQSLRDLCAEIARDCRKYPGSFHQLANRTIPGLLDDLEQTQIKHEVACDTIEGLKHDRDMWQREYYKKADELTRLRAAKEGLFDAIKHGDKRHKRWLKLAIIAHFNGKTVLRDQGWPCRNCHGLNELGCVECTGVEADRLERGK